MSFSRYDRLVALVQECEVVLRSSDRPEAGALWAAVRDVKPHELTAEDGLRIAEALAKAKSVYGVGA